MTDNKTCMKTFINLVVTMGFMGSLSFGSFIFCNWYGCNSMSSFFRADMICNMCSDISYHLKNYQIALYGSAATLISYQMTSLVNKAAATSDKLLFENYLPKQLQN